MKQPNALYLLNFVSMWECFSYYGMRVLLVLYMTSTLGFSDTQAFALYAIYTTLVELGGVVGGLIADRVLGLKKCIVLGGWTIALGHISLAFDAFYIGLGLISVGTCLFTTNVAAFLGSFYSEDDPRRESGYTIYYTGINIGSFLAAILCGVAAENFGWHAGFGLAAIGMLVGNIALLCGKKLLVEQTRPVSKKAVSFSVIGTLVAASSAAFFLRRAENCSFALPFVACGVIFYLFKKARGSIEIKRLSYLIGFLVVFYACEEQLGSSLVLFSERFVQRDTLFGVIPAASLTTFNPLTILIAGPLFSRLLQRTKLSDMAKIQGSFLLLGASFMLLYASCFLINSEGMVHVGYAVTSIILIALGEILIGPTIYAAASKAGVKGLQGLTMGMVTLGFSLANLLSGHLSQTMAITQECSSISVYSTGFAVIGFLALVITLLVKKVLHENSRICSNN